MSSRKRSTSTTEESSSGSTSDSSTSSGSGSTTASDTGTSSDSESTSTVDEKPSTANNSRPNNDQNAGQQTKTSSSGGNFTERTARRKSSDKQSQQQSHQQQHQQSKQHADEKPTKATGKNSTNRGQRLSKSSIYSSDDDLPSNKKHSTKTHAPISNDKKKLIPPTDHHQIKKTAQHVLASSSSSVPPSTGGKAPPSVVKQQQQQNFAKTVANRQNALKATNKSHTSQSSTITDKMKKKSIFSPDNSSYSDDDDDNNRKHKSSNNKSLSSSKQNTKQVASKAKPRSVTQKKISQPSVPPSTKKNDPKSATASSASTSSSGATTTSSDSDDSDSSEGNSSPGGKRPPPKRNLSKTDKSDAKTVAGSDTDNDQNKMKTVRKLTRSSSTRKSKHLTGKATESDSDVDTDKRSISKSPVKKAPILPTKSKTKAKRDTKLTTPLPFATPPVPEEQKCPVEGCDSSGHLSGNLEKHFLPEACPMYHNMSVSEAKERANERKLRMEERRRAIEQYDPTRKFPTPEQKAYQMKIREARAKFKPVSLPTGDKIKTETNEIDREPNLNGLVPDYDLQLFREAQAIASEKMENELKNVPVGKGIKYITMGKYQMKVWYQSPYPDDAGRLPKMYICEFCLRYQKSEVGMKRHAAKCVWRHPPGDEIYRKGKLQVWQVDGKRHKQYCQHLCLLAKFFLDHKTLYYDVEPFLFYVMTLADSEGCHTVGYFSKEKNSFLNYNVSCILTLPPYQRKGYGRLLIDFSYLLTRVEGKIGSPEKPLSDLGLISYRSYWKDVLLDYLCTRTGTTLSIKDVSQEMAISSYDIVSTLQALGMMKYWKGKHIILKKQDVLEEFAERVKRRGNFPKIDRSCLRWTPFVPPQSTSTS